MTFSLAIFSAATGSMIFATYSAFYGRRAIYLVGIPFLVIGSIGVALSRTVNEMIFWRCVQAMGTSGGMSVGAAVLGDIYKLTERGTAMGIFFGATLAGAALAPLAGGWGAHYASWRWTQVSLGVAGLLIWIMMAAFLPETIHPGSRGMDKYRVANGLEEHQFKWIWLNPFSCFTLLRSPNLLLLTICTSVTILTTMSQLVPIAYTLGRQFNITNEFLIGACYIPLGLGNCVGSPIAGRLSDLYVIRSIKRHGKEVWRPEERLKAAVFGALVPVPLSILLSGLATTYLPGPLGLTITLVCFFTNGMGADMVLTPVTAYAVDILRHRSAEVMAATMGIRAMLLALALTLVIPGIDAVGLAVTYGAVAGLAWIAGIGIVLTIKYGERMRGWIDIDYTDAKGA